MSLSLQNLIETHFRPKRWQFWRRQRFHVCHSSIEQRWYITDVPKDEHKRQATFYQALRWEFHDAHHWYPRVTFAVVESDRVLPKCIHLPKCEPILAADPRFFYKLDRFLEYGAHYLTSRL